jgi:hypothetical protein
VLRQLTCLFLEDDFDDEVCSDIHFEGPLVSVCVVVCECVCPPGPLTERRR